MASEKWWNNDGYGNQAIRASISLWKSDDGATSVKIHATGGAETYNSDGWGGSYINFAGQEQSGGCYGYSYNYYWAHSSWWWSDLVIGTFTKTHETQTITRTCYFTYGRWPNDPVTASASITIGAKASYTVSYALDGGSGTFEEQKKWHGENLSLRSGSPTKSGFLFKGWSGSDGNTYQPGATYTGNSALTLTAIWQAAVTDLENVADIVAGQNPSFSWTPQAADLTYKINLSIGEWSWTSSDISPGSTDRYTYNSYTVPVEVCNQIPTQVSGLMTAELETYSGGTLSGSSEVQFVVSVPISVVPTISSGAASLYPDNGLHTFLQNYSKVKGTLQCTSAYSSPIVEAKMTIGEDVKTVVPEQDALDPTKYVAELISDILPDSGSVTVAYEITDARGRTKTNSITITVYEYYPPVANVSVSRMGQKTLFVSLHMGYCEVASNSATYRLNNGSPQPVVNNSGTAFQTLSNYLDSRNYTATLVVTDAITSTTATATLYPGKGNRFETLSEEQFYVGMDDEGWKNTESQYGGGITEDGTIWFQREGYTGDEITSIAGVGIPVILESDSDYELLYSVNEIDDATVTISYYWIYDTETPHEGDYTYVSKTESISPGDMFHTPDLGESVIPKILWGLVTFGVAPKPYDEMPLGYREFSNVILRKVDEEGEALDWEVETGDLGLESPLHKYISKVVIRMAFEGTMEVEVSYDNGTFTTVCQKTSALLRSYDIPINVKRCDHFRFRISGTGVAKIYSIGYSEEIGSEVNEQS